MWNMGKESAANFLIKNVGYISTWIILVSSSGSRHFLHSTKAVTPIEPNLFHESKTSVSVLLSF